MLLPIIGAGLGGLEAYRRTGGDIGATLLGAGLGAAVPSGLRMAGTALGAKLGAPALTRASADVLSGASTVGKYAQSLGTEGAKGMVGEAIQRTVVPGLKNISKGIANPLALGGLAAGTGVFLGAPAIAGALASKAAGPAGATASRVGGLAVPGMQPGQAVYDGSGAVPSQLPVGASPYNTAAILDPGGPFGAARTAQLLQQDIELAGMRKIMPEIFKASEARSKTEFQRQMAAAGVRQNIMTAANMLERSQQAAQQMGLTAAQQAGSALTQQYQYS